MARSTSSKSRRRRLRREREERIAERAQQRAERVARTARRAELVGKREERMGAIARMMKFRNAAQEAAAALAGDERVRWVKTSRKTFAFQTNWIFITINGRCLRVGRFEMVVEHRALQARTALLVKPVETGMKNGSAPIYSESARGTTGFCFGSRTDFITELVETHELLAASYLVLESLEHVNAEAERRARDEYVCVLHPDPIDGGRSIVDP